MKVRLGSFAALVLSTFVASDASAAFSFSPGNYYGTNTYESTLRQYNASGVNVETVSPGLGSMRGLAFGPDNLLYVVGVPSGNGGQTLNALNSSGAIVRSYAGSLQFGSTITGGLAVDSTYAYVAGQNSVYRYRLDSPAAQPTEIFTDNQLYDIVILPNGNLLAATAYTVKVLSPTGTIVREFGYSYGFTDLRGVAYDPKTDAMYVTQQGNSGTPNKILKYNFTTGQFLAASPQRGFDIVVNTDGNLVLAADGSTPKFFSPDLTTATNFTGGDVRTAMTQYVPEPAGLAVAATMFTGLLRRRRRDA